MQLNTNLSERLAINTAEMEWLDSPSPQVKRRPLERFASESGRATSVVSYAAGASFAEHAHPAGEEIMVLEGTFSDASGDYSAGSYLRNPPGSRHAPFSRDGCLLFVKLAQFQSDDLQTIAIDTRKAAWHPGLVAGLSVLPLAAHGTENTALVRWAPGTVFSAHRHYGGEEIFVLSGVFEDEHGHYPAGTWLRSPHLSQHRPFSRQGCTIFVKTGHLLPGPAL
ncbi:MAG: cupin domain-containing protein [Burkholderiaceae bacterium]